MTDREKLSSEREKARRGLSLAQKYALLVGALMALAIAATVGVGAWFAVEDQRALVARAQHEQARSAAQEIDRFVGDIAQRLQSFVMATSDPEQRDQLRSEGLRLMRETPAILDLREVSREGRENLSLSRLHRDRIGSGVDRSSELAFRAASRDGLFIGSVVFHRDSEPRMEVGARMSPDSNVALATVNLTFIWDLVAKMKVGVAGNAYVSDAGGRLIAHPNVRAVLRDTRLGAAIDAHRLVESSRAPIGVNMRDIEGRDVLSVSAPIERLGWRVFVDVPRSEAFAPIRASIIRSALAGAAALAIALLASVVMARRMAAPIRDLRRTAARIGAGELDQKITVATGDEIGALGDEFNRMAARLSEERTILDRRVAQRTADLQTSRDDAERATEAKSRLLTVVGHDIRTPLAAVVGVIGLLDRQRMAPDERRLLEMAVSAGDTLVELVNGILDLSRLETGAEILQASDFDIVRMAETAIAMLRPEAERRRVALSLNVSGVNERYLNADGVKLNRIILNLLRNAVSCTREGAVELVVAAAPRIDGRSAVTLAVRDTGVGVPREMQEHIFHEFTQLAPRASAGGVGLGLAICRRLADLLGGVLSLESEEGRGSVFTLTAVLDVGAPDIDAAPVIDGSPQTVLVIDDDDLNREVTLRLCRSLGHRASGVARGADAVAFVRDEPVDAVLLDMHMADMDGAATARALSAVGSARTPRMIGLTADSSPRTLSEFRTAGVEIILAKPVRLNALAAALTGGTADSATAGEGLSIADEPLDQAFIADRRKLVGDGRLLQLIALFSVATQRTLAQMRAAADDGDGMRVARAAHQLASAASAIGCGAVFAAAGEMSHVGATMAPPALRQSVESLALDCAAAERALAEYVVALRGESQGDAHRPGRLSDLAPPAGEERAF